MLVKAAGSMSHHLRDAVQDPEGWWRCWSRLELRQTAALLLWQQQQVSGCFEHLKKKPQASKGHLQECVAHCTSSHMPMLLSLTIRKMTDAICGLGSLAIMVTDH